VSSVADNPTAHQTDSPASENSIQHNLSILVVIPTYNNRPTLLNVVSEAVKTEYPVLVVNDGSDYSVQDLLKGLAVDVLDIPDNRGKGLAIQAGAEVAKQRGFTHIITLDADGQHDPDCIPQFAAELETNPWCIVVGERDFPTDTPGSSVFGRKFSNFWVRVSSGKSISDTQSGYRAYPVEAVLDLHCLGSRYEYEVEILVRGMWAGLGTHSVSIPVQYTEETTGASHFRSFKDNARISLIFSWLVIRHFIPWPHRRRYTDPEKENLSFRHFRRSLKQLFLESNSPLDLSLSAMLGVFLGTLPLIGVHSIVILYFATKLGLNRLVAFNSQHICFPPFVPALAVEAGHFILNGQFLTEFSLQTLGHEAPERLLEYLVGSLVLGPILAILIGMIVYSVAVFYRRFIARRTARADG